MQTFNYIQFLNRNAEGPVNPELNDLLGFLPRPTTTGPWIAGGAVRRMITDGVLGDGDIDYFFNNQAQFDAFCTYMREQNKAGMIVIIKETRNEHNLQFKISIPAKQNKLIDIQAITLGYYLTPEHMLSEFDFTVCQFAYDGTNLLCGDTALWDLARKRIVINKVRFPVPTLRHMIKYSKQGFFACGGALTEFVRLTAEMGVNQATDNKYRYID